MKKLTNEQIEIIKDQIEESVSCGNMYPNVARTLLDMLEVAINYTCCCNKLKDEEEMTFTKWLDKWNWKQVGNGYLFKRNNSYADAESLMISYKKEYNL